MDETENELTQFNKEFKTSLIRPIIYNFKEDMSVKHQVNFNSSLFTTGLDKTYDLTKFKTVLSSEGLDLYDMGKSATVTKSNAQTVFSEL